MEQSYLDLQRKVLTLGIDKGDRTGTGTRSLFGEKMVFDLRKGFPLLTTKQIDLLHVLNELIWFLDGSTIVNDLVDMGTNIWNKDAYRWWKKITPIEEHMDYKAFIQMLKSGKIKVDMGPIYGHQWRAGLKVDQLINLMSTLETNPDDRRMIVSAWNPGDIDQMALPPCHIMFQVYTVEIPDDEMDLIREEYRFKLPRNLTKEDFESRLPKRYIDLQMYQRSCDLFLGVPYNIASYAALLSMIAMQVNMVPRYFHWLGGDVHIYSNHFEAVKVQLDRQPLTPPTLVINPNVHSLFDYKVSDFKLYDYSSHAPIKASLSVG